MRDGQRATADEAVLAEPIGYLALLRRNADFRRLWLGSIVSLLGDWFNTIALYSLIATLTGSPFALGLIFLTKMVPWALASPVAGLIVDRFDRRRVMIASDLLRAVVVLGFLVVDEPGDVPLLYALTALQVVVGSVFQPAKSASIPNLMPARHLLTANALSSATWSVMLALGAALGGFATEGLGPRAVFVIDSMSYLVSAYFVYRTVIPQHTEVPVQGTTLPGAFREMLDGWQHLRTHPQVGRIAFAKAVWAVAGGALVYMLTLLGDQVTPGAQAAGIGLLFAARGLGTGVGPVVARALFKDTRRWPAVLGGCIVFSGLCYGVVGLLPWATVLWTALFVVLAHASSGANWVLATVMLQQRTQDRYRGRVFATEWLLVMGFESLSILMASLLLEWSAVDLRAGFQVFAVLQVLCGIFWLLAVVPRERRAAAAEAMT